MVVEAEGNVKDVLLSKWYLTTVDRKEGRLGQCWNRCQSSTVQEKALLMSDRIAQSHRIKQRIEQRIFVYKCAKGAVLSIASDTSGERARAAMVDRETEVMWNA
jgi:transcriptional regulator of acetoin/glycerol metabolism